MIYLFLAEGFEEVEALTSVDLIRRAGLKLETVSITSEKLVNGAHGIKVYADRIFSEADFDNAEMLVLPGGSPGWKNLDACDALIKELEKASQRGKYIAAICGAPSIIGRRGFLKGKNACIYPGMEDTLVGANANDKEVNIDGKFITSRGVGTAIPFALAIIKELTDAATADKIATGIVYNISSK